MVSYDYSVLGLTSKCNLHCPNCFRLDSTSDYIRADVLEKILDFLKFIKCKYLCISGGEPLLHPEWEKIICLFYDNGIIPLLSSNASLIQDLSYPVFQKIAILSIPLDGFDEYSNDMIRGAGHFSKVTKLIDAYDGEKYNFRLKVNTIINKNNYDNIEIFIERFKDREGIIWKLFEVASRRGDHGKNDEKKNHVLDFGKLIIDINKRLDIKCKILSLSSIQANNYLLITADGEVFTPELDTYKRHFSLVTNNYKDYIDTGVLIGNKISHFYPDILS